jgi:tetratricopeptide (TPR) repeat protein
MTKVLSKEIELELEKIENEYIKEMYMIRYNEVMSYIYLRVYNNPDKARECADKILESNAEIAFKGFAYYIKGYSYMFTSHEKAMGYLNKSVSMYEKLNRTHDIELLNKDIEFVNIFWGKCDKENTLTIKNQVFLQVSNNKKVDIVFLEEVKEQEFKLYFEGCMNKDNKKLMLSLIKFIKKNDLFLANIPRIALIRNGYDEEILDEMISMQVA